MPSYLYKCPYCGWERQVRHSHDYSGTIECESCGAHFSSRKHKKPQAVAVNWNGNARSEGGVPDLVEHMIADAPRRRDKLAAHKEARNDN
jgi:uncharacterized Zn finger protein